VARPPQIAEALLALGHSPGEEWLQQVLGHARQRLPEYSAVQLMGLVGALEDLGAGSRQALLELLR
jgi:hypothetical protein